MTTLPKKRIHNKFLAVEHLLNSDGTVVPMIWDFYLDTDIWVELSYESAGYLLRAFNLDQALYTKPDGFTAWAKSPYNSSYYPSSLQGTQNGRNGMILTKLSSQQNTNVAGFVTSSTINYGTGTFGNRGALGQTVPINSDYGGRV